MPYVELSLPRRRWIADLAEAAFADAGGVIPVQPAPLIDEHGITFSSGDYGSAFDGMLEHRAKRFHIYCNTYALNLAANNAVPSVKRAIRI